MKKLKSDDGFTIIELMIATTVLSAILVLVTIMMISIGNLYYKGINQARVQSDARSITEEVTQHLQLTSQPPLQSPDPPPPGLQTTLAASGVETYCIGTTRYTYRLYRQIGDSTSGAPDYQTHHVLWRDTLSASGSCLRANLDIDNPSQGTDVDPGHDATDGTELIAPNSRLTAFFIWPLTSPYTVAVGVAYGDNDLLCDNGTTTPSDDCTTPYSSTSVIARLVSGAQPAPLGDVVCRGGSGGQFCSTASLSTTTVQRLTGN